MRNNNYKFGFYCTFDWKNPSIGIGWNNFHGEKYLSIDLLFWDIAIGRTGL